MSHKIDNILFDELTADPSSPAEGQMWHRIDLNQVRCYLSGATKIIAYYGHTHDSNDVTDLNTTIDTRISGTNLDVLANVSATSPFSGSVIKFDGSQWVVAADELGASGSGEANTGNNSGTGLGWFKNKTGTTLNFRTLLTGSSALSASQGTDEITLSFDSTAVDLDDLGGVSVPSPTSGSILKFDGSNWVDRIPTDEDKIIYVGKHGNDSNDGKRIEDAVLTFGQAVTLITAESPSSSNVWSIVCLDAGIYNENITISDPYVYVHAANATVQGNFDIAGNVGIEVEHLDSTSGSAVTLTSADSTATSYASIKKLTTSGSTGLKNNSSAILNVEIEFYKQTGGIGVDASSITHVDIQDWDLYGVSPTAVKNGGSTINLRCANLADRGGSGTSLAFDCNAGTTNALAVYVSVDTCLEVESGATLNLIVASCGGTETNNGGTVNKTEAGDGETNTASNLGSGLQWFSDKSGVDLRFRSILTGSNKLSGSQGANDITLDVVESNIDHGLITGLGDDDHTQYQLRSEENQPDGYVGMTGSFAYVTGAVLFNTTVASPTHQEGLLFWDSGDHTVAQYLDEADITQQLGQEGYIRVYNGSGATINNGTVVYVSGTEGVEFRPAIALADASDAAKSHVIGFATHNIENGTFGYVTNWGLVNDLDTSAYAAGATLYLDDTTPGAISSTPPGEGGYEVQVGYVIRSHATLGRILVQINSDLGGQVGDASQITVEVIKDTAGTINPGDAVYVDNYNPGQDLTEIELANASAAATMPAIGLARDTITSSQSGRIVLFGKIKNQDTSAWAVGDALYVDTTDGQLTNVKPTGTALVQKIGVVARSHASAGVIEVFGAGRSNDLPNVTSGSVWVGNVSAVPTEVNLNNQIDTRISGTNLNVLSDVNVPTPVSGNVLAFDGSGWIDAPVSGAGGGASALNDLTDVTITSVAQNDFLIYSGSQWVNLGASVGSYSEVVSSWTLDAGNIYYDDVTHNLNTDEICVFVVDDTNNKAVQVEEIEILNVNTVRISVNGNSHTLRVIVTTGSPTIATGSGETNTASNLGSGIGWYSSKSGVDLRFRSLVTGSNILSASFSANEVTLSADASNINLDDLGDISATSPTSGSVLKYNGSSWIPEDDISGLGYPEYHFDANTFDSPVNSDWTVNALAPAKQDGSNAALTIRAFDDTTEEGVGMLFRIPTGATNMIITVMGRAATAPGAAAKVGLRLYNRKISDNAAVTAWSSAHNLTDLDIPTNANFQKDSETISLSTLGVTAGELYQWELTRNPGVTSDLTGDWNLVEFVVSWS